MKSTDLLLTAAIFLLLVLLVPVLTALKKISSNSQNKEELKRFSSNIEDNLSRTRSEMSQSINSSVSSMGEILSKAQERNWIMQNNRISDLTEQLSSNQKYLQKSINDRLTQMEMREAHFQSISEKKLESIREAVEIKLDTINRENSKKLDEMRATVDEKLQKTLDDRLSQSFSQVSTRLEEVYKGLGEMQKLASGVGDLKKVLSNVKTRGILGEIQLGAILEEILSPEQYETNVATKKGSSAVVEFAVKLPGDGIEPVYLPIDSKFPADRYEELSDAYDSCDKDRIKEASKNLERALKASAKEIHDKYIDPPYTTDFGIMFLPFEGLYAEAVRMGLIETLARDYRINIAGPTTTAALLNSLQMGFRTLAIQKRSGEVWEILGAVKTEFSKFSDVLETTRAKLRKANDDLDILIGTRTRAIQRKLREVSEVPSDCSKNILEIPDTISFDGRENQL